MSRLIDANLITDYYDEELMKYVHAFELVSYVELEGLLKYIDNLPTVDPVVRGRIVTKTDKWHVMRHECSVCGEVLPWKEYPNYYPNCGAKMYLKGD